MANQNWPDRLRDALERQGLPPEYVDRLAGELADHWDDLSHREQSMEAQFDVDDRLGLPGQLAASAQREFQRRTFAGRHPALTFLVGPVVTLLAAFVATLFLLFAFILALDFVLGGLLGANDLADLPPTPFETSLMYGANGIVSFVPFVVTALLFFYLSRQTGRPRWGAVACGLVAFVAICFYSAINPPGVDSEQGTWIMGLAWQRFGVAQVLQALTPVLLGVWVLLPYTGQQKLAVAE